MYSVTQRIKMIQQPKGGYVKTSLFQEVCFEDGEEIVEIPSGMKPIQGMVVDYLTRFMIGESKEKAFEISMMGANAISESKRAQELLEKIKGLDEQSIQCACKLVGYDVIVRRGYKKYYVPMDMRSVSVGMISNIQKMVKRSLTFFKKYGPVIKSGFTMEGGYNGIISTGDGDYLTKNTLWDFKTSMKPLDINQTLQIAVYYVMGMHSIHPEFKNLKKVGIYNPILNKAYIANISDIGEETFLSICKDVVGYETLKNRENWRKSGGTDKVTYLKSLEFELDTGFRPNQYEDGIFDISLQDYWSYWKTIRKKITDTPNFSKIRKIKLLKNNGFCMFVSVAADNTISILHGARTKKLQRPINYYYDRLPEYGNYVLSKFSKYWESLYEISNLLKSIKPTFKGTRKLLLGQNNTVIVGQSEMQKKEDMITAFEGRVHGCIVDLDYSNHIFLNPYDGTITPYSALSMSEKYVYNSVERLIADKRPEMLAGYKKQKVLKNLLQIDMLQGAQENTSIKNKILKEHLQDELETVGEEKNTESELYRNTEMYEVSSIFMNLQAIYDNRVVTAWYDNFLKSSDKAYRFISSEDLQGRCEMMRCGMKATVISDNGAYDISVKFEDGTVVEHITRTKFRNKTIENPNLIRQQSEKKKVKHGAPAKKSYVGQVKKMNNGRTATIIEDFGCNDITVQFDDGLIRKHCRRDKFKEGKIAHVED